MRALALARLPPGAPLLHVLFMSLAIAAVHIRKVALRSRAHALRPARCCAPDQLLVHLVAGPVGCQEFCSRATLLSFAFSPG